jgi:hypothetical protein
MSLYVSCADYYNLLSSSGLNSPLKESVAENEEEAGRSIADPNSDPTVTAVDSVSSAAAIEDEYVSTLPKDVSAPPGKDRAAGSGKVPERPSGPHSLLSRRGLSGNGSTQNDGADALSAKKAKDSESSGEEPSGEADSITALKSAAMRLLNPSLYRTASEEEETVGETAGGGKADGDAKTSADSDRAAILAVAKSYVNTYNTTLKSLDKAVSAAGGDVPLTGVTGKMKIQLHSVGITVNSDNSLSIDEDAFLSADMSTIKALFSGFFSYAASIAREANLMANSEADAAGQDGGTSPLIDTEA